MAALHDSERVFGAMVLCGGHSRRMGQPKAWLPFGGEALLQRVVAVLRRCSDALIVVAAPDQSLPELPSDVRIVRDPVEGRGPLQGIAVGLATLAERCDYAFVSATDAPFLVPSFVRSMRAHAAEHDAAVAMHEGYPQPLAAVYRTSLARTADDLLAGGESRLLALLEHCRSHQLQRQELLRDAALRHADPQLWSLRSINTPAEYRCALRDAGDLRAD